MSDHGGTSAYDEIWVASVAATRGVALDARRAREIAARVAPTLRAFAQIARELRVDDDVYEFRRLIAAEVPRDG